MTKVTVIVFTYNRALQLDAFLESLFNNFTNNALPVHVIYHWSKEHELSYNLLQEQWEKKGVQFHRRGKIVPAWHMIKYLFRPLNLYWYIKTPWLRKRYDDFKKILEGIIEKSPSEFISLSTDDQLVFNKTIIPEAAIDMMRKEPKKYSYRFITSLNFKDEHAVPAGLETKVYNPNGEPAFFEWSNSSKYATEVWKYRFHVDGAVYEKRTLLALLKPMLYHMPTTLESGGLWESRLRNYYATGLSSVERTAIGVQANNIQTISDTPCANFDPLLLMQAYLGGYRLIVKKADIDPAKYIYIPSKIYLQNKVTQEVITYSESIKK